MSADGNTVMPELTAQEMAEAILAEADQMAGPPGLLDALNAFRRAKAALLGELAGGFLVDALNFTNEHDDGEPHGTAVRAVVAELIRTAAFLIAMLKSTQGETLSPARFAAVAFEIAEFERRHFKAAEPAP